MMMIGMTSGTAARRAAPANSKNEARFFIKPTGPKK